VAGFAKGGATVALADKDGGIVADIKQCGGSRSAALRPTWQRLISGSATRNWRTTFFDGILPTP
jgi:hypothetical protein